MDIFLRVADPTDFMPNNFPTKAHDCRLLYILSGKGRNIIEGKTFQLKANTLCYYPTGTEYYPISSKTDPIYFITMNFDLNRNNSNKKRLQRTVKSEQFEPKEAIFSHLDCEYEAFRSPFVIEDAERFREQLLKVCDEFKSGKGNEPAAAALLQYTLLKMVETKDDDALVITLYEKAVDYINQNYSSIKDNREIAEALNYHEYYINRMFKLKTGKTLHKYIIDLRLEKAANLLADGLFSVGEVAKSVGFYNADHFSKRFYEKYGMSPSVYKKKKGILRMI